MSALSNAVSGKVVRLAGRELFDLKARGDIFFESPCIKGLIGDFQSNPKRFWTFLKCIKGSEGQLSVLRDGEREVSGDIDRANLLNRTFAEKFTRGDVVQFPDATVHDLPTLDKFTVSETAIRSALHNLQVHKACGPDNVSARIIKECSE